MRGESCTGKTRTAFEAVQVHLSDWQLVFPKNAKGLLTLLDADALVPRTVLWLNETQNFLIGTDGEEVAAALHSRLEVPGPVVVLCTLWPEYHRTLTATPDPATDTDAHPLARALLSQAKPVDVPASFAPAALKDLRVSSDRSLATALSTSTGGRITQTLAAGPQLVDHYQQATGPHGPYGHAVVTAAMDARRLGHTSLLPAALLKAAAPGYLTEQQRATDNGDTWFSHALDYAREKVRGVAAALEPVANPDGTMGALPDVYRLSDYLEHYARTNRRYTCPPESFWTAIRDAAASTADLNALAEAASSRLRYRIAADLYQSAAGSGDTSALLELARLRWQAGDTAGAERLEQRVADAGDPDALFKLAWQRKQAGDVAGAKLLVQRAAGAGQPDALREVARLCEEAGDVAGAERLYREAADAGSIYALQELVRLRCKAGDTEGAERFARQAADAGDLSLLGELARWREEAGDLEGAERAFALFRSARPREEAGDAEGAERFARRAADAGAPDALLELAEGREEAGDVAGAERLYREAADAGSSDALRYLVRLREEAGDAEGAARFAQRAADFGDPDTLWELALAREKAGGAEGVERLYQRAADSGSMYALRELVRLRAEAGDKEGVKRLCQRAADFGDPTSIGWLTRLRDEAGDPEGAKRLWRFGLEADGSPARPW
ncbi:hypothetical protein ABZ599_38725 [Streptomyces misionensis]|uniref:tetratricopeptide repeat protein n=1 Tax=Streptomyces misionensis TaxID=67331 RepID=UPI0033D04524